VRSNEEAVFLMGKGMFLTRRERLCVNEIIYLWVHEFFTNWAVPWHRQFVDGC
jgi:hypothetical protein